MFKYWRRFDTNGVREWTVTTASLRQDLQREVLLPEPLEPLPATFGLSLWHTAEQALGAKRAHWLELKFPDAPGKGWWFICLHPDSPSQSTSKQFIQKQWFLMFYDITLTLASSIFLGGRGVKSLTLSLVQSKFSSHDGPFSTTSRHLRSCDFTAIGPRVPHGVPGGWNNPFTLESGGWRPSQCNRESSSTA